MGVKQALQLWYSIICRNLNLSTFDLLTFLIYLISYHPILYYATVIKPAVSLLIDQCSF